ncbi:uncharacterized protein [Battus philenor]|uniref:uncharacterized protein n=1 Tax=Battus philenor TaxID=42288 RepID=UPI0035D083C1
MLKLFYKYSDYMLLDNFGPPRMKKSSSCVNNLSKAATTMALIMTFVVFLFYYNTFSLINFYAVGKPLHEMTTTVIPHRNENDFLIDTDGCAIPNLSKNMQFHEAKYLKKTCGERVIFVSKIESDKIKFRINEKSMKKYSKGKHFNCCYKFANRSIISGKEDTELTYSKCNDFKTGTISKLEEEVITVVCSVSGKKQTVIYEDAYFIIKKINTFKNVSTDKELPWNVLLVGIDTMSRGRVHKSMPKTVAYLQENKWLDFRGYHKVGSNTFPNLISFLTGKKLSTIYKASTKDMTDTNELMIWSKYKNAGYVTAYGEEYLKLPDTFGRYHGFKMPPTNHYARPFFLTGEERIGNYICTGQKPSAIHLLDYALDFTETYVNESFFGLFWLNSFSHSLYNSPTLLDKDMVRFFEEMSKTGALNNTFIIFLSDHGIRYGEMRLSIESYYEDRLPMLFMFVPFAFREKFPKEYNNLETNQYRLSTPYDLHLTMMNILNISKQSIEVTPSEACPKCTSLFYEKSLKTTCEDSGISDKWCSCHNVIEVKGNETDAQESLRFAVSFIQNKTQTIETTQCMECEILTLKTVLRHHFYVDGTKAFHVVAILMSPGDIAFEVNVLRNKNEMEIVGPTETISEYNTRGNCVKNQNIRQYCYCRKIKNCKT